MPEYKPYTLKYHYLDETLKQIDAAIYTTVAPLEIEAWRTPEPIPFAERTTGEYITPAIGESWGGLFDCAWFHFTGDVPERDGDGDKPLVLLLDVSGEMCVFDEAGAPVRGLTSMASSYDFSLGRPGKRVLPLGEFITGVRRTALRPGELLSAILVPQQPDDLHSVFLKAGARKYLVISIAMVAVAASIRDEKIIEARIAAGSCSPVAQRLHEFEAQLAGHRVQQQLPQITPAHLAVLSPISDVRGSAQYRSEAVTQMIGRALAQLLAKAAS